MIYYIIGFVLFIVVIVVYSILISKSKSIVETSEKMNSAMGNYFILLSNYEKILKEKDAKIKKEKSQQLLNDAKKFCQLYPSSPYTKDIEKLIEKLNDIITKQ